MIQTSSFTCTITFAFLQKKNILFLFLVKKMLSRPVDPVDDPFNFREVVDEFRKQKGMLYI